MTDPLPEQERRVRDLLAQARHDEPTPPEVVARLEETLAELHETRVGERPVAGEATTVSVTDLAARRRRRIAGAVLVAATLVVVGGVGVDRLAERSRSGSLDAGGSSAGEDSMTEKGAAPSTLAEPDDQTFDDQSDAGVAPLSTPVLESATLRADVLAARSPLADDDGTRSPLAEAVPGCDVLEPQPGSALSVLLDGEPGLLVLRPPSGGTQVAEVAACAGGDVRRLTLPAP